MFFLFQGTKVRHNLRKIGTRGAWKLFGALFDPGPHMENYISALENRYMYTYIIVSLNTKQTARILYSTDMYE